ncbi:MAG: hypothetical protein U0931_08875 [Vulcanimicrobiota bacterium]
MPLIAWIPIILLGGLFGSVPFLILRGFLYLALRVFFRLLFESNPELAALFSRRIAAVLCLVFSICTMISLTGKMTLDGGISFALATAVATYLVWMPASGKFPEKGADEEPIGVRRLS